MRGILSAPSSEDPATVALDFFKTNADLFRARHDAADLRLVLSKETPGGHLVRLAQTFSELPVFFAGFDAVVGADGALLLAHNRYVPAIDLDPTPPLSREEATTSAWAALLASAPDATALRLSHPVPLPELGVLQHADGPRLAYRVVLSPESPSQAMEFFVDAERGSILATGNLHQTVDRTGQVFDPNPVNTLYPQAVSPQDPSDAFSPAYFQVQLRDLVADPVSGMATLAGPYVHVTDVLESPFHLSPSLFQVLSTGDFVFQRNELEFEHVMAYFHIDSAQRYVQSIGFPNILNRPVLVDPHGLNGLDNSHYNGTTGHIAFGAGAVEDAEDADIILHEYGHAIQDDQAKGTYFGQNCTPQTCANCLEPETPAMGEGFGDYWAASRTHLATLLGQHPPECFGEWDNAGGCLRRLDSQKRYDRNTLSKKCHDDGEIWSATLWDLFQKLGVPSTSDTLVLQSHFEIQGNQPTFADGADALIDAGRHLKRAGVFSDDYRDEICEVVTQRGISPKQCCTLETMAQTGPELVALGTGHSINDLGVVAFAGSLSDGKDRLFVATEPGAFGAITCPAFGERFSTAAINNELPDPYVASRELVSGSGLQYRVRKWRGDGSCGFTTIGTSPRDFASATSNLDMNDNGTVVFTGRMAGVSSVVLFYGSQNPPDVLRFYPAGTSIIPQLSNDDRVVFRDDRDQVVVRQIGGGTEVVASPGNGFTNLGEQPGISPDGSVVGFFGTCTSSSSVVCESDGGGVYVARRGSEDPVLVAGPDGVNPDDDFAFSTGHSSQRVGVTSTVSSTGAVTAAVLFTGTRASAGGTPEDGLYTRRVTFNPDGTWSRSNIHRITGPGDDIDGNTIETISLHDPVAGTDSMVFGVTFADSSSGIVRGTGCLGLAAD